mgnify:CR=1 FL=1
MITTTELKKIYPMGAVDVKALDGVEVPAARILPSGSLEHDREFAILDGEGKAVNGKRNPAVHGLRGAVDYGTRTAAFRPSGDSEWTRFALEDADLFNILCVPAAASLSPADMRNFYSAAEAYCEERRAFLIMDIAEATDDLDGMQTWLTQNVA